MKRYFLLLIVVLCFAEMNWEIEIVDSALFNSGSGYEHALALDTNDIPHLLFTKNELLILAKRLAPNIWTKVFIDSGSSYTRPSLVFDKHNIPHCCYYERVGQNTYHVCYTYKDMGGCHKEIIDTILGGSYRRTQIDVDASGNPGIAYVSFNPGDTMSFIKYAYFDGLSWNFSVVEYDTGCTSINPDRSHCLKFNSHNIPHIAYHHIVGQTDTIKLAYWSDSLNRWLKDTVYNHAYGCAPISFAMNNQDEPYIAHGVDVGLYCSFRHHGIWYHEYTGFDIGWLNTNFVLHLDSVSHPSMIYFVFGGPLRYLYKDTIWHDYGCVDSMTLNTIGDINLSLDRDGKPCVSYLSQWHDSAQVYWVAIKYAKGTFVGIEESDTRYKIHDTGLKLKVFPNFTNGVLHIEYDNNNKGEIEMTIYDVSGAKRKSIEPASCPPGYNQQTLNLNDLASGIYFLILKQNNEKVSRKFLLIR